jgi:hypothetical protein
MRKHKGFGASTLVLLFAMAIPTLPVAAKSSPHNDTNATTSESTTASATALPDRSTDATQDDTTTTTRHVRPERRHGGKRRGIIIGATALTGMVVGAGVAGPVGALAGAGIGAGVGLVLAHVF